ncbi:MAG: bifunctional phosphoribosylaminoimidazolecarboxamide formyltransferase/IMP cyclohydrolase, partial [Candidatus Diapherotrites archaeon]|nr:bifunctional phosphoribosylaminoimidazolecarboxamide formyltransferase/IMP cyclohydrolase [Candidatus Diapherotrites archaeon]
MRIKRALLSVYDKTGLVEFARFLHGRGVELIASGGTFKLLKDNQIPVKEVSALTGFPEILDGRVKTLHPKIHGGILAKRNLAHLLQLREQSISEIDLVCVNLYPFLEMRKKNLSLEQMIDFIDVGGPTLIRAAAKNHPYVCVVTSPAHYDAFMKEMSSSGGVCAESAQKLAMDAFALTAHYDASISAYLREQFNGEPFPSTLALSFEKLQSLRYGENPHQHAAVYHSVPTDSSALVNARSLQGKELSFNNFNDANSAVELVKCFSSPACVIVKHANPSGVAVAGSVSEAFAQALECDPASAFGVIIALNRTC